MSRPSTSRLSAFRSGRRPVLVTTALALAATATLTVGGPANSVPGGDCPDAFPAADLVRGQAVDGLTVSEGNTPDPFTGEVLGVLEDGIGPGVDMILVRLSSTEIDRVGGIWSGMSGSPVYAADGTLIGAVSYGLSWGPSPVAGVTPAADMTALLDGGATPRPSARSTVTLPRRTADRLVSTGALTRKQAEAGLSRLRTPVGISGAGTDRLAKINKKMKLKNVMLYAAGRAPAARAVPADAGIVAGGNLAVALSYGDFSAVGTGTATVVCGNEVVGFGHPMDWSGSGAQMTMHGADALYIQEDPVFGAFKVSNPTGPVGTITEDRLPGVAGSFGALPDTTRIDSTVDLAGTSTSRTGTTYTAVENYLPDIAALAHITNSQRVLDQIGEGSSSLDLTISGMTAGGAPFEVTRSNAYASRWDISWESGWDIYSTVNKLLNNKFTAVDIDSVDVSSTVSPEYQKYTMDRVERKVSGEWKKLKSNRPLKVSGGDTLRLRVTLGSFRDELGSRTVKLRLAVPEELSGTRGAELVVGGGELYGSRSKPGTFAEFVDSMNAVAGNDEVSAQLSSYRRRNKVEPSVDSAQVDHVVGGQKYYYVRVK